MDWITQAGPLVALIGGILLIAKWLNDVVSSQLKGDPMRELVNDAKDPKNSLHGLDKRVALLEQNVQFLLGLNGPNWVTIEQIKAEQALIKRDMKAVFYNTPIPPP